MRNPAEWETLPVEMKVRLVRMTGTGRDGKPQTMYVITTVTDSTEFSAVGSLKRSDIMAARTATNGPGLS